MLHFHPLLPLGKQSTKKDIGDYLNELSINKNNFQLGESKVSCQSQARVHELPLYLNVMYIALVLNHSSVWTIFYYLSIINP